MGSHSVVALPSPPCHPPLVPQGVWGPLFAITAATGEISHIAIRACWGLKCQPARGGFQTPGSGEEERSRAELSPRPWPTWQTLTGTYANRHIKAHIHALVHPQMLSDLCKKKKHIIMRAHAHTCTDGHTCMHAHTHTHVQTYAHTHLHTHTEL